jgi:hypothetical protein
MINLSSYERISNDDSNALIPIQAIDLRVIVCMLRFYRVFSQVLCQMTFYILMSKSNRSLPLYSDIPAAVSGVYIHTAQPSLSLFQPILSFSFHTIF